MTTQTKKRKTSPVKVNYLVDLAIFVAFLVAMDPRLTGIAIHEWLSIAFGAAIITHLVLHWKWLVATTTRFLKRIPRESRLNYILNTLFFIDIVVVILSGIMISEAALPLFGLELHGGRVYRGLHSLSANLSVIILGLHVALHWKWIANATKRYIVEPLVAPFKVRRAAAALVPADEVQS